MDPLRVMILVVTGTTGLAAIALGALVLLTTPRRAPQLLFVAYLACVATNMLLVATMAAVASPFLVFNAELYSFVPLVGVLVTYPLFVAANLDAPLTRPLRTAWGRGALCAMGLGLLVLLFARPYDAVVGFTTDAEGFPFPVDGPFASLVFGLVSVMGVYTFACAIVALRRAPRGTVARDRAKWFAIAFGTQDAFLVVGALSANALGVGTVASYAVGTGLLPLATLFAMVVVAVAMVRESLFDAELKLKASVRKGSFVAIFLAGFFVVTAIAEQYLQQEFGLLVGGIAIGLMLFAMRPIERAAARIADATMPRVQDTPEYRLDRKREVYRAAVEGAMQDGAISEKERDVLARVADHLGLTVAETVAIEREAVRAS